MKLLAKSLFAVVTVAGFLSAEQAEAALIDSFESTFQSVVAVGNAPQGSSADAAGVLGGERDLFIQLDPGTPSTAFATLIVDDTNGLALYAEGSNANGLFRITWDGDDDNPFVVDPTGLGPTSVFAGSDAFRVTATSFDAANATVRVWSEGTDDAVTKALEAETLFPFTEFSGINFASVGALQLTVDGAIAGTAISLDVVESVTQDEVVAPIPEPSSAVLLALGLVGMGGAAARRRRKPYVEG